MNEIRSHEVQAHRHDRRIYDGVDDDYDEIEDDTS